MRFALLAVLLSACGTTTIDATKLDRTCSADADCVAVFSGDVCDCSCDTTGINKKDLAKYDAERAGIKCSGDKICGPCQTPKVSCSGGTCTSSP